MKTPQGAKRSGGSLAFALLWMILGPDLLSAAMDPVRQAHHDALSQEESLAEGEVDMERLRITRRAQAFDIDFFAPYYSIEGRRDTLLFVMNRISEPISVELAARSGGRELALGSYSIEAHEHVEVSLRQELEGFEPEFGTGSLRLSLLGDPETVQAWAVLSDPAGQTFEIPFKTPDSVSAREFYAFWDATALNASGRHQVVLHLLNVSRRELSLSLSAGSGPRRETAQLRLQPGESVRWSGFGATPLDPQGWLELSHDGEPGDLVGVGLAGDEEPVGTIPLIPRGEAEYQRHYESLPLPEERGGAPEARSAARGWISLLSVARERQKVLIEALDAASGDVVAQLSLDAAPFEVVRVPLARLVPGPRGAAERLRLRVEGQARGLLVQGTRIFRDGSTADLAFSAAYHAHGSAIYPLPDARRFESVTSILNLGHEPSKVVAQVYWTGGTFSLGPLTLAAGASHEVDLDSLARQTPRDLLDRPLDPYRPSGVLQWTVMSGSRELVGRTFVRPRTSQGRFGFNCAGCCPQQPKGAVVPGGVNFFPGQTPSFEVAVIYDTCTGTMGPYPTGFTSLSVPSPFSWNGQVVGASGAAQETLGFTGSEVKTSVSCNEFTVSTIGTGMADTCKNHLKRPDNPSQSWNPGATCISQTGNCSHCNSCCDQILAYNLCRRVNSDIAHQEHQTCRGHCLTDRCG